MKIGDWNASDRMDCRENGIFTQIARGLMTLIGYISWMNYWRKETSEEHIAVNGRRTNGIVANKKTE